MSGVPENGWYAVLEGEQSGPMELSVLLGAVSEGRADGATFVWRPGYPEWKRAGEVEGLGELITAALAEGGATTVAPPATAVLESAGYSDEMRKTVAVDMDAVVRAAQRDGVEETPEAEQPVEAANEPASATMDALFSDDPTPSASDAGGGFFDVPEQESKSEKVMLYQRRDTSVLFSLDDFGKGGGGGDSRQEAFAERTAESGLIDIRAVARKTSVPSDATPGLFENSPTQVAASSDFSTRISARTEPLIAPRKKRAGVPIWAVVVGGLCVATLGALGALLVGGDEEPVQPVTVAADVERVPTPVAEPAKPVAQIPARKAENGKESQEAESDENPGAGDVDGTDEGSAEEAANPPEQEKKAAEVQERTAPEKQVVAAAVKPKPAKKSRPKPKPKPKAKAKSNKAPASKAIQKKESSKKTASPKPAPKKAAPAPAKSSEANQATALLNSLGSGGGGAKASAAPAATGSGKKKLSKSDIRKAIKKHTKGVIGCYNKSDQTGGTGPVIVTAKLKVASSGSVSSVSVLGALGSGAVGSCISSKLKTAKFPAFDDGPQTVSMTFRVR